MFIYLFPNKAYQDSKIRYILSDLTGLLKKFIAIEFDSHSDIQNQFELSKTIGSLKMEKLFKKEWNKFSQTVESPKHQNASTQYYVYQYYLEAQNLETLQSRKGYAFLPQATYSLESHFVAERLRLACLGAGPQSVVDHSKSLTLLQSILEIVESGVFDESPAVIIYYYAYKMLFDNSEDFYFKLSKWLDTNWSLFPLAEVQDIYLLGINFCISKINSANRDFMRHAFDLYKSGLAKKAFMNDGYLSIHNYKNILRLGLTQEAYEWT